jgi:cob(I)alamin adenosyltransferase
MTKSKIYTRTGDRGTTSIIGGRRISKTSDRIEAYGTLDELNSFTGLLRAQVADEEIAAFLYKIQQQLFSVGGCLASETGSDYQEKFLQEINPETLEEEINRLDSMLPPLRDFVVAGENIPSSQAHICRTICRRAERRLLKWSETEEIPLKLQAFINRLSDYFFVLSRILEKK